LIGFALYADSLVPLTLDHDNVLAVLEEVESKNGPTVQRRNKEIQKKIAEANWANDERRYRQGQAELEQLFFENKTAIGDALALAVVRMRDLDERLTGQRSQKDKSNEGSIKGKVIILLTDGENNAGDLSPEQVAPLIKASGIKLYAIGIGSQGNQGAIVDEEKMKDMARQTGGAYFRATDSRSLREVYAAIDKLEKTRTEEQRFMQYKSLATSWTQLGNWRLPPLLLIVVGLLVLELLLSNTRFRRMA
jgi:Ca-activated chloride channel family protein